MPATPRAELITQLENSFRASGYQFLLSGDASVKPFRFIVYNDVERYAFIIYAWTLTQGGGAGRHRTDEYKIQMTLSNWQDGLLFEPGSITLLLGWSESLRVWAGFDAHYHQILTGRSNMVSIYGDALQKAVNGQIGMSRKANGETSIAFPPFFLVDYAKQADLFHGYAQEQRASNIIEEVTTIVPSIRLEDIAPAERALEVKQIALRYRNRRFRYNILAVYKNRCAMTGMQLELVDAAHIIDVAFDESTDEIKNGLCLSASCHRAFDAGLIVVTPDYHIVLNREKIAGLQERALAEGLDLFKQQIQPKLLLPADSAHHPSPAYLQRRFELHGWNISSFK
jgi:putative restriction endonuclease